MTLPDQFRTALANVGRRKLRSALASLGVVVGVVTIVVLVSLASGVRAQINNQFASLGLDRLVVNSSRRWNPNPMFGAQTKKLITSQDIKKWRDLSGVKAVIPEINLPSGVEMELSWNGTNQTVRTGRGNFRQDLFFQEQPQAVAGAIEPSESSGIIVSQGAVQGAGISSNDLALAVGKNVEVILRTPRGEKQSFPLRIQGVSQEKSPTIRVSVNDCAAMKNWWFNSTNLLELEGYDTVVIRTEDVTRANTLSVQLRNDKFQVQSLEAFMSMANHIVSVITLMFTLIGSIALLVAAIGIANTMVMATYERTREIGILKAMGASNREISRIFMLEAGFIGMLGGFSGVLLGWFLTLLLNPAAQAYARFRELPVHAQLFLITPTLVAGVILFATVIGLVAGLLPAQRAAKLNPLDALRHE